MQRQRRDIRREIEQRSDIHAGIPLRSEATPEKLLQQQEKLARFESVIKQLSPAHAEVIQLRSIQELPFEEVAKRMDRSVNAVSKLWNRAVIALQEELSKLDDSISP